MAMRRVTLLIVALLIAGLTVLIARTLLSAPEGIEIEEAKAPPVTEVLVASSDLPAGTILKESDLKWLAWPLEKEMEGFAVKGQSEVSEYVGNVVRYGMRENEPILPGRVVKQGERGFMAAALIPGLRAVSISVTPTSGVAGFIFPGDRVDVIVTHEVIQNGGQVEGRSRKVSETMLRNVRVLALDQKMNDQLTEAKLAQVVTLEVSSKQAETLALAAEMGTLSLALRSIARKDLEGNVGAIKVDDSEMPQLTWDSDISQVLPSPANRTGAVQKIKIIRGSESTEAVYDLTQP